MNFKIYYKRLRFILRLYKNYIIKSIINIYGRIKQKLRIDN